MRLDSVAFLSQNSFQKLYFEPPYRPPMLTFEEAENQQKTNVFNTFSIWVVSKTSSIYQSAEPCFYDLLRVFFVRS